MKTLLRFKFLWSWKLKELKHHPFFRLSGGSLHSHRELWGGSHRIPTLGEHTATVTAHRCSCRYKMAVQPLSQIVTWANKLLDGFLCFPVLADCCGQSVGAALNLKESKESNWGMIYSLLLAVKKKATKKHPAKWSGNRQKKWFFLMQHRVKLELSATGCCGGQNKAWVKSTCLKGKFNEGSQTQRCEQNLWLVKPSCLLPKSMRLYSEKHHWMPLLLLLPFLKCPPPALVRDSDLH